jgi:hypothetical protein
MSTLEPQFITRDRAESKLTDYELDALSRSFNFADGHARYPSRCIVVLMTLIA